MVLQEHKNPVHDEQPFFQSLPLLFFLTWNQSRCTNLPHTKITGQIAVGRVPGELTADDGLLFKDGFPCLKRPRGEQAFTLKQSNPSTHNIFRSQTFKEMHEVQRRQVLTPHYDLSFLWDNSKKMPLLNLVVQCAI